MVATNDKSFITQSIDAMKTMKGPFYSFMITLSGHHPFEQEGGRLQTGTEGSGERNDRRRFI